MKKPLLFVSITLFLFILFQHASAQTDQTVAAGASTTAANFPSGSCVYSWVNSNPSIGLATSGLGNIASFKAVNNGNTPVTAAITATPVPDGLAYIENYNDGTVSVVSISTNKVLGTVPVGTNPFAISASPDGSRLYIVNSGSGSVSVVNTSSNQVIETIPAGPGPFGIVVSPDGSRIYVTDASDGTVSVFNTGNYTLISTVATGAFPTGIAVSPDGRHLYVANTLDNTVSVINTTNNTVVSTIPVGTRPYQIAASPDGSHIYVSNNSANPNGTVSVINTSTNLVEATIIVGYYPDGLAISSDGSQLFVANSSASTVSVINTSINAVSATIALAPGSFPKGLSLSPDNSNLYVAIQGLNGVAVINTKTNNIIATTHTGPNPTSFGNFIIPAKVCSGMPVKFNITVNPASATPPVITASSVTGSISACVGAPSVSPNVQQFTVTGSNLTSDIAVTAPPGFEVSLSAPGNYGSALTISRSNNATNQVIYVRSSSSASAGNISGNVVVSKTGAESQNVAVTGVVNALPTVDAITNQVVQSGANTTAINFTGTGNTFNWVNDTPGIGLPSSGTGDIGPFKAINNGATPVVATVTVTPASAGSAYVPISNSNTVSVINTANNTVVTTIKVGSYPFGVLVSKDGSLVYVTNIGSNTMSVISTATNTVIATVAVGANPHGLTISSDGSRIYVANAADNTISVINAKTYSVIATVPAGTGPQGLVLSPDGQMLYVTDYLSDNVSVINTVTNQIINNIPVGANPLNIVGSPDGSLLYLVNYNSDNVSVINRVTNQIVATIPVDDRSDGICISPDGKTVYVANQFVYAVRIINTSTNQVTGVINTGPNPSGVCVSPDSRLLYVTNNDGTVAVFNTTTRSLVATIKVGGNPIISANSISRGSGCPGAPIKFTITVNPTAAPIINGDASTLSALTTTYGTPSASASFKVSGANLTAGILVTPPPGFEVSTDNTSFSGMVTIGAAGNVIPTLVYIRLTGIAAAENYLGNIVLSSAGAANINVPMPLSIVTAAPLIVRSDGFEKQYGTMLSGGSGYIYFNTSGLQNSDLIISVTVAYGAGAEANAAPGTYTGSVSISAATGVNFNSSNYSITYVPGDLIVFQAPAAAISTSSGTLSALTTTYGTPSASESFTVSGTNLTAGILVTPPPGFEVSTDDINFSSTVTLMLSVADKSRLIYIRLAAITAVGNYSGNVNLSSTGASGITFSFPFGTVNPAPLTVTADDKTRTYGTPNPVFTVTYSGFVNNEGVAQLTYQPLITTTAIITSPAGGYPITASGAVAANYTFTYTPGVLNITSPVTAIVIPNTFTPNGDGINDSWNLKFIDYFPNCSVNVFNRYGEKVYFSIGYPVPWDGRYKGAVLPTGVYYYIINENNGSVLSGNVTIIR